MPTGVQATGPAPKTFFLAGFALPAHLASSAVAMTPGVGTDGVSVGPATASLVQRGGSIGALANAVRSSFAAPG
ncbi:hypothetical protein ACFXO2_06925 [Streptomyces sp. NPDC059152]|uniref:hypothetical protein n=1 Tax=Streptomyces sp. NPDC059152 TaxID=3346742 RepID=UPI0036C429BB